MPKTKERFKLKRVSLGGEPWWEIIDPPKRRNRETPARKRIQPKKAKAVVLYQIELRPEELEKLQRYLDRLRSLHESWPPPPKHWTTKQKIENMLLSEPHSPKEARYIEKWNVAFNAVYSLLGYDDASPEDCFDELVNQIEGSADALGCRWSAEKLVENLNQLNQ
jgi:hypothetical protein